jgi:K+-transporting ATPase ATPase A chain
VAEQLLPMGPAASQIAIKQLGTNGGGFFAVNSARPFENPTPLSNLLEMLAILLIPAALCHTFGTMVRDTRQGRAILAAMTIVFVASLSLCVWSECRGNPRLAALGVDVTAGREQTGGNMEGKVVRFGVANSALWATATTAAANGSVNSMHDSFTPLGGLVPLFMMQLGEVIFGGVAMLITRYWLAIPTLAIAGSLARKRYVPVGAGTLPTHTPLFFVLLIGVVIVVGVLTFVPALALGPIVEHLLLVA